MIDIDIPWDGIYKDIQNYRQKVQAVELVAALYESSLSNSLDSYAAYAMVDNLVFLMENLKTMIPYEGESLSIYLNSMVESLNKEKKEILTKYAGMDGVAECLKKEIPFQNANLPFLQITRPFHLIHELADHNYRLLSRFLFSHLPAEERAKILKEALTCDSTTYGLTSWEIKGLFAYGEEEKTKSLIQAFAHTDFDASDYLAHVIKLKDYERIHNLQEIGVVDFSQCLYRNSKTKQNNTVCALFAKLYKSILPAKLFFESEGYRSVEEEVRFHDASSILNNIPCEEFPLFFSLNNFDFFSFSEEHIIFLLMKMKNRMEESRLEKEEYEKIRQGLEEALIRKDEDRQEDEWYQKQQEALDKWFDSSWITEDRMLLSSEEELLKEKRRELSTVLSRIDKDMQGQPLLKKKVKEL